MNNSDYNFANKHREKLLSRSQSSMQRLIRIGAAAILLGALQFLLPGLNSSGVAKADTLNGHTVVLDDNNKIIPWTSNPANGYIDVVTSAWDYFLNRVPNDPSTGKPAFFSQSYLYPDLQLVADWPHNPAGLYAMLIESALKYYAYSGDITVVQKAEELAVHHLDNGMTPSTWLWDDVPYASGDAGSLVYEGASTGDTTGSGDGRYYLEPDKIGELAYGWLLLYKFSGNTRYRDAAIHSADVLAAEVRTGNDSQSPWPFRVHAQTGQIREDYCAHVVSAVELFDELIRLGLGNTTAYQKARQTVWAWTMNFPMQNNVWANYFEDVGTQGDIGNINQMNPMMLARYIIEHPESDPNWETHVRGLIAWVENKFAVPQYGANAIQEQNVFMHVMGSHTSRYASINALLYARTGDLTAKEKAYRAFNWATYMARPNGIVIDGPTVNNQWFTDGYGDYIRHFMTGLHAIPEWAPEGETHITGSSSVVTSVAYRPDGVDYVTADSNSTEVLRIAFVPSSVSVDGQLLSQRSDLDMPGWTFDSATGVMRIRHDNGSTVKINAGNNGGNTGGGSSGEVTNEASVWAFTPTPQYPIVSDSSAVELGVKFKSDVNGFVTGIRFYKGGSANDGVHVGHLWTRDGTLIASATFSGETASGWQQVRFPTPVAISANTVYVASYHAPNGHYAADYEFFAAKGVDNGLLHLLRDGVSGGNGVYRYGSSAFPTNTWNSSNYWVDVSFMTGQQLDTVQPTVIAQSPAPGATGIATGATVTATFSETMDATTINTTTIELRDSANAIVPAAVSYDQPNRTATLTPTNALTDGGFYTVTVKGGATDPRVKDSAGNPLAANVTWSFTTAEPLCASTPCSAWTSSTVPGNPAVNDPSAVELGVKFRTDIDGFITGLRFYKGSNNSGTHTGKLWTIDGRLLAAATFTNETASGWQQVNFSNPVAVAANTVYVASYYAPNGNYAVDNNYFANAGVDTGVIHLLRDGVSGGNGVYAYGTTSTFPSSTYQSSNYWVDVVFSTKMPAPSDSNQTPTPTGISIDKMVVRDGRGSVLTPSFSTSEPNTLLLAFVGSDGPVAGEQAATVTGAGLKWTLVKRTNTQAGTSEVWSAQAAEVLTNATVQSAQTIEGYDQSLTVVAIIGASGVGTSGGASASSGAPSVSLTATKANSWVFGVGNDWDNAVGRTLGAGQTMIHQWVNTGVGDTFWVQRLLAGVAAANTTVSINDTAPTTDRWNLTAVEVVPK